MFSLFKAGSKWSGIFLTYDQISYRIGSLTRRMKWKSAEKPIKRKSYRTSFLTDVDWSQKILQIIESNIASTQGHAARLTLFLANPGKSPLLSEALTQLPSASVVAWEPSKDYTEHIQNLVKVFPGRLHFYAKSFIRNFMIESSLANVFSQHEHTEHIVLTGHVPQLEPFLIKLLSLASVKKSEDKSTSVLNHGPMHFDCFLFVSEFDYKILSNTIDRRSGTECSRCILSALFCECKLIFKVPVEAFNRNISVSKAAKKLKCDTNYIYLIQIKLRTDVFNKVDHPSLLPELVKFITILSRKRIHRVIPMLEHLCPDVGIQLIELGISMLDEFKDLPFSMWPKLFQILTNSSGYEYSALKLLLDDTARDREDFPTKCESNTKGESNIVTSDSASRDNL